MVSFLEVTVSLIFHLKKKYEEKICVILNREHLSEFFMEMHKSFFVSSDGLNSFLFFAAISLFEVGIVLNDLIHYLS